MAAMPFSLHHCKPSSVSTHPPPCSSAHPLEAEPDAAAPTPPGPPRRGRREHPPRGRKWQNVARFAVLMVAFDRARGHRMSLDARGRGGTASRKCQVYWHTPFFTGWKTATPTYMEGERESFIHSGLGCGQEEAIAQRPLPTCCPCCTSLPSHKSSTSPSCSTAARSTAHMLRASSRR